MTDPDYSPSTTQSNTAPSSLSAPSSPTQAQSTVTIGIQGGQGSFNEEAVQHYLKKNSVTNAAVQYLFTSDNVMEALKRGDIDRGQCAIYNSVGGYVEETTTALEKYPVRIIEEFEIKIAHALMIRPDQDFAKIDTIMCHPQVLAQCKSNLKNKYPHFKQTSGEGEYVDNAKTAEALSKKMLPDNTAVMGSKVLAAIYGLQIIEDNLQDAEQNYTRFIHVVLT
jgi:prephenate dehydratase